jgi:hypothetical protein
VVPVVEPGTGRVLRALAGLATAWAAIWEGFLGLLAWYCSRGELSAMLERDERLFIVRGEPEV